MLRPTPGELLAGVRRELTEAVLPQVPAGEPTRQLRAALHVLAHLERTWDLLPEYLRADVEDLRETLAHLRNRVPLTPAAVSRPGGPIPGVQSVELAALMAEHGRLSEELAAWQRAWRGSPDAQRDTETDAELRALHERMASRARGAAGLADPSAADQR